jgi:aspartate/tyrosine/aromatic aminotransferase
VIAWKTVVIGVKTFLTEEKIFVIDVKIFVIEGRIAGMQGTTGVGAIAWKISMIKEKIDETVWRIKETDEKTAGIVSRTFRIGVITHATEKVAVLATVLSAEGETEISSFK